MRVYGQAAPPYAFLDFCVRFAQECAAGPMEERRFVATPERLAELHEINRVVNSAIEPTTDIELYGVEPTVRFTEVSALVDNGIAVSA